MMPSLSSSSSTRITLLVLLIIWVYPSARQVPEMPPRKVITGGKSEPTRKLTKPTPAGKTITLAAEIKTGSAAKQLTKRKNEDDDEEYAPAQSGRKTRGKRVKTSKPELEDSANQDYERNDDTEAHDENDEEAEEEEAEELEEEVETYLPGSQAKKAIKRKSAGSESARMTKLENLFSEVNGEIEEIDAGSSGFETRKAFLDDLLNAVDDDIKQNRAGAKRFCEDVHSVTAPRADMGEMLLEFTNGPIVAHMKVLQAVERQPEMVEARIAEFDSVKKKVVKEGQAVLSTNLDTSKIVKHLRKTLRATIPPI